MIPPQAIHYMGLTLAKVLGWGVGQLSSRGIDALDLDIRRLSNLDEPSLLTEIARRDNADIVRDKPDQAIQYGRATVDRMLPWAQARICPHRDTILNMVDSPEVEAIKSVVGYLAVGPAGALIPPLATLLVKRGIPSLCGAWLPSTAGVTR